MDEAERVDARGAFDVSGRVVIVTGATGGIGGLIARWLHAAGCRVVASGRRADRLDALAAELPGLMSIECDLLRADDRAALVVATLSHFGRVDGLVNNAGVLSVTPASREDADQFRASLEIDLVAPYDLARQCLPAFRSQGSGVVVNITSMSGIVATGLSAPSAGYCSAKAGLAHLTRELATQWGRYNVRVNAVAPGFFPSEMTAGSGTAPGSLPPSFVPRTAIARPGGKGDIEGVVQFLLSDAARYVTGQQIAVDGGYTVT